MPAFSDMGSKIISYPLRYGNWTELRDPIMSRHVTSVHGAGNKASRSALLENALSLILCMEVYKGKAL